MSYTYKFLPNYDSVMGGGECDYILRKEDNCWIPKNEANTDYQEYLAWVAEGNTAEAAD